MDDEDVRCLLDVICDPQALNEFLHGSENIASEDLLDSTGDAASAFFEGAGLSPELQVQESSGHLLSTEQSPPAPSVDFDFLEEILGCPLGGSTNLQDSGWPCDILQQSLQEASLTEDVLKAEAERDLGLTLPALPNPTPPQNERVGRFQQMPEGFIPRTKEEPPTSQASMGLCQVTSPCSSILLSDQGLAVRVTPVTTTAHGQVLATLPPSTSDIYLAPLTCLKSLCYPSFSSATSSSSSLAVQASSSILPPSQCRKRPLTEPPPPIHPTKVRKHSGNSPNIAGAKATPAPDRRDEAAPPPQTKSPVKTPHEAHNVIRLNMRVRQEGGRIKVVHSTVIYPVFQRPARSRPSKGPAHTTPAPEGR